MKALTRALRRYSSSMIDGQQRRIFSSFFKKIFFKHSKIGYSRSKKK